MGESPWSSPVMLWEQKLNLRPPQETTAAMQRGKDLESMILAKCEEYLDLKLEPAVFECVRTGYEWMGASVDGYGEHGLGKEIVEIKCASREDHESARKGIVPQKYVGQLTHILWVCDYSHILYASYHNGETLFVRYEPNWTYLQDMLDQERKFWECLQNFEPPALTDKDFVENNSLEWKETAENYLIATKTLKDLEEKQKAMRNKLIALAQDCSMKGSGLKLTRFMRKGNVRYQDIEILKTIDLDDYRSKPSVQWRIT
jgi:putative phage-type endonuclease